MEEIKKAADSLLSAFRRNPTILMSDELGEFRNFVVDEWPKLMQRGGHVRPASPPSIVEEDDDEEEEAPPDAPLDPEEAEKWTALAKASLTDDERIANWTNAIRAEPTARRYTERGEVYLTKHENQLALDDAASATRINPDSARSIRLRAVAKFNLNDAASAYADMCEAQKIDYDESYDMIQAQMKDAAAKQKDHTPNDDALKSNDSPPPLPSGGLPGGLPGGLDLGSFMNNPAVMNMAQNMMKDPELMRQMMQSMGAPPR